MTPTVEIENIHRNLAMQKPMVRAILDGASQIAVPGVRLNSLYLHRFCADLFPQRYGQISLSTARHGGDFRHARFLSSLAHSRSDDGEISSTRTSR
jgi:hypothetical protein